MADKVGMELIIGFLEGTNRFLSNFIVLTLVLLALLYALRYLFSSVKKSGLTKGLYLWSQAMVPVVGWLLLFWLGIFLLGTWLGIVLNWESPKTFIMVARWVLIWITFCPVAYLATKQHGEKRGLRSMLLHVGILQLGWIIGQWMGIVLISLPIIGVYYNSLYHLANGILPVSDPEDRKENWQRFRLLAWYMWGLQYPIQVAYDNNSPKRDAETRISGSPFNSFSAPGLVWLRSHQAAAFTSGVNFTRVEGPRVVFTKPYERLFEVVDLRTHLRSNKIEVVSKDGVRFKAVVFASFAMDREKWNPQTYNLLYHQTPSFLHANKPDANLDGIFPFSRSRIQAAIKMRGKTSTVPEEQKSIYWDERVFNQVEVTASHILSERKFDELWHPINDGPGISALDEIADQMRERLAQDLLTHGVRLFAARVVAFDFSEYQAPKSSTNIGHQDPAKPDRRYDDVIMQQIESWRVNWESQRSQIITDADAEANRIQQEARAYVQSVLLTAIADGLQQTRIRYPNLPRHVIAMHFVGAIEQIAHSEEQQDASSDDSSSSVMKPRGRFVMDKRDR
jgi:hypothetical protein